MKMITVAFDIDGTLRNSLCDQDKAPVANEDVRSLLIFLSRFKNILIHVWSGAGELYARQVVQSFGLSEYVDSYSSKVDKVIKGEFVQTADFKPDIAIDDIEDCKLGEFNLIVAKEHKHDLPKDDPKAK